MKEPNRKCKTQQVNQFDIPPLKLSAVNLRSTLSPSHQPKDLKTLFKAIPADQNSDFLKEKTLYRFAVSRKLSRKTLNKSQNPGPSSSFEGLNLKENSMQIKSDKKMYEDEKQSKMSHQSKKEHLKQPHFARKTNHVHHQSTSNFFNHQSSYDINQNQQSKMKQVSKLGQSQLRSEVERLKRQLLLFQNKNRILEVRWSQKNKECSRLQSEIRQLHNENAVLKDQIRKCTKIHSDRFIDQQKLSHQVQIKEEIIKELTNKIKYIEIENRALKKFKADKVRSNDQVIKLERKNRELSERIKLLTQLKTRRTNQLKGSMMSECSDMSLNLSADQEDMDKLYSVLKTAERTPTKLRPVAGFTAAESQEIEMLSPFWNPQSKR